MVVELRACVMFSLPLQRTGSFASIYIFTYRIVKLTILYVLSYLQYRVSKKRRGQEARRWNDKNKLVGFRREKAKLGRLLRGVRYAEKNCLSQHLIISVWGIAGVGKSALIKSIYYEKMQPEKESRSPFYNMFFRKFEVEANFFSWVDVPHPFSLPDFSRRLLLDFHSDDIEDKEIAAVGIMEGQDPMEECRRKFLRQGSCFVVIDGLDSKYDWDLIKAAFLSERTEKACIIVITREESVATYCADKQKEKVVNVTGLETEAALGLFMQVSWDNKDLTEDKKQISECIVAKCGGLPQLITAIGNHVSERPNYSLKSLNDDFMGKLETNPEVPGLRGLFSWMHSYFDACSDYLKPCIFYLSVFSADRNIRWGRLLRRWMAEGYSRDSTIGTAEKQCETFFSELVRLSIIQHRRGRVSCHVNGFFHEYIRSRPMEDNLVFALEGFCRLNSQRTGQHLTIRSCWNRDKTVFESLDFSRLRSFTVFGEWRPFFMSANNNMRLLRVLDLEDTSGLANDDLRQVGKLVPRLKFLSLRGCRGITNLPDSVGDLRQLQTLDVTNTSIVTLPRAIIKLQKLRYICAGTTEPWDVGCTGMVTSRPAADEDCDGTGTSQPQPAAASPIPEDGSGMSQSETAPAVTGVVGTPPPSRDWPHTLLSSWLSIFRSRPQLDSVGVKVPLEIGKLAALHTLGVVDVSGAGGKDILKELKKLTQLHKLRVSGVNKENYLEIFSAILGHVLLESLSVRLDKDKHGWLACLDGVPLPPKSIKKLKLYGYVHKMPIWVNQLDHLEKLDLEMTIMAQGDMDVIEELPRIRALRRLCVKPIQDGKLSFGPWRSFKTYYLGLRVLKIDCTSSLEVTFQEWITEESVEQLILHCSRGSSLQIAGIKNLKKLKQVWLKGSYGDALKQSLQGQINDLPVDEGQEKPILKLEQINGC